MINFLLYTILLSLKRYFYPGILFYEGNIILILVFLSFMIISIYLNGYNESYIYKYLIGFLFCLVIHTTIITIVDRSISVFILDRINRKESNIKSIQFDFENEYSKNAISKRIQEQLESKNIHIDDYSNLKLTNKGFFWITVFRLFSNVFSLDPKITK